jgi:hypothetical protein
MNHRLSGMLERRMELRSQSPTNPQLANQTRIFRIRKTKAKLNYKERIHAGA